MIEQDPRYQRIMRDAEMKRLRLDEKWTLSRIGDHFGVSRERVRQIIGNTGHILRAERAAERAAKLRELADQQEERRVELFWLLVDVGNEKDCWEWTGSKFESGYGRYEGQYAHRVSWVLTNGSIEDGLWVLHSCDNPACVNPTHLSLGTPKDNHDDAVAKGRKANGNY